MTTRQIPDVLLANPRGFCAGVDRAIQIVERALEVLGPPIYVRHQVVHNRHVVDNLRQRGAIFVESLNDVPNGETVIFSAHGVPQRVRVRAKERGLKVFDATCPLVTKVHLEVARYLKEGLEMVLIGHAGHPEVQGTMGQAPEGKMHLVSKPEDIAQLQIADPEKLAYLTQTTLSMDDTKEVIDVLKKRFPHIRGPKKDDICYATQNRQDAVKRLCEKVDLLLVVGAPNSSNSNRLAELGRKLHKDAHLIEDASQLDQTWLTEANTIGITAGASAPEHLVQGVVKQLQAWGVEHVHEYNGVEESIVFSLPAELQKSS